MYAQVEKPKESKSKAAADSVTQKKNIAKQYFGFVDNRPDVLSQQIISLYNNAKTQGTAQRKGKVSVKSEAKIKHKTDNTASPSTETQTATNDGGPYGQDELKAHPQTNKLLTGYAESGIGAQKFVCAEPHALSKAVNNVPVNNEITNIEVKSELDKNLPQSFCTKKAWMEGGYYGAIRNKGESIRRCPTCVSLLGDDKIQVTKNYSK